MSKFNTLFEEQISQYTKPGPVAGDYVKIRSNYTESDWWKGLDEARQNYVNEILTFMEQGKNLMLSTIKRNLYVPEPRHANQVPSSDSVNWTSADVTLEHNPGFYTHTLTIPVDLLEFDMTWDEARGKRRQKGEEREVTLKPQDVENKSIDIGQQTHVPGGDYKLSTEQYLP